MPPTNTTPETATVITTLPVSLTQTAPVNAGEAVWFRYAATATAVTGWQAYEVAAGASLFRPKLSVWQGPPGSLTEVLGGFYATAAAPISVPMTLGVTYYFKVQHDFGAATTGATMRFRGVSALTSLAPVGSLVIPDDTPGFPLTLLSATTGEVLQHITPFPEGEAGDVLPSGVMCVEDGSDPTHVRLYTAAFLPLASVATPVAGTPSPPLIRRYGTDTFLIAQTAAGDTVFWTVSATGTIGATTRTLTGQTVLTMAVTASGLITYTRAGGTAIQRYDFTTGAALTDLATVPVGYGHGEMIALADGTLVVGYGRASPLDGFVRQYAAAGATVRDYPLGAVTMNDVARAPDDPASFWVWLYLPDPPAPVNSSRFTHLRTSDGTTVATFDLRQFAAGVGPEYGDSVPADPDAMPRAGHSFSCPFFTAAVAVPSPSGGSGAEPPEVAPTYDLETRYIRRLRRAPHLTQENTRVFIRRFELDLERGQGRATEPGADPIVLLRISRDGGQTWGEELRLAAGALGAYTQRVLARRLGHGRDLVFEVTVSDPIAWSLVGAWVDVEPGSS